MVFSPDCTKIYFIVKKIDWPRKKADYTGACILKPEFYKKKKSTYMSILKDGRYVRILTVVLSNDEIRMASLSSLCLIKFLKTVYYFWNRKWSSVKNAIFPCFREDLDLLEFYL